MPISANLLQQLCILGTCGVAVTKKKLWQMSADGTDILGTYCKFIERCVLTKFIEPWLCSMNYKCWTKLSIDRTYKIYVGFSAALVYKIQYLTKGASSDWGVHWPVSIFYKVAMTLIKNESRIC